MLAFLLLLNPFFLLASLALQTLNLAGLLLSDTFLLLCRLALLFFLLAQPFLLLLLIQQSKLAVLLCFKTFLLFSQLCLLSILFFLLNLETFFFLFLQALLLLVGLGNEFLPLLVLPLLQLDVLSMRCTDSSEVCRLLCLTDQCLQFLE